MQVRSTAEGLELIVALPGLEGNDIEVGVSEGHLIVHAERRPTTALNRTKPPETGHCIISRAIELPERVDADKIFAVLSMGVLTVSIPVPVKPKFKKIEVVSVAQSVVAGP